MTWIQIDVVLMGLTQELDCETSFFFFLVRTGIEIRTLKITFKYMFRLFRQASRYFLNFKELINKSTL